MVKYIHRWIEPQPARLTETCARCLLKYLNRLIAVKMSRSCGHFPCNAQHHSIAVFPIVKGDLNVTNLTTNLIKQFYDKTPPMCLLILRRGYGKCPQLCDIFSVMDSLSHISRNIATHPYCSLSFWSKQTFCRVVGRVSPETFQPFNLVSALEILLPIMFPYWCSEI